MANNIPAALEKLYADWKNLHENGGSDPSWSDGDNLNLIRNQIISCKQRMAGTMLEILYAELCNRPLPQKVDSSYMAKPDEIRTLAALSLERYKLDPHYQFLSEMRDKVPKIVRHSVSMDNVLGYVRGLEIAIRDDDLVAMRVHRKPETYLSSFASCAERVRENLPALEPDTAPKESDKRSVPAVVKVKAESYETYLAASPLLRFCS